MTAKHTVVITAEYNQDGTLKSYTIKIDDKTTSTYTATYDKGVIKTITSTKDSQGNISESAILKNSKMSFLTFNRWRWHNYFCNCRCCICGSSVRSSYDF